ncbi:MAG: hypothetical protein RLY86_2674 [Pseudomonadota bacterium]|jgi:hypothetical protein
MLSDEKVIELVAKLTRLTIEGRLAWVIGELPHGGGDGGVLNSPVFCSNIEGVDIRIYEMADERWTSTIFTDDGDEISLARPKVYRYPYLVLELIGEHGFADAEFRDLPGLRALFKAVRVRSSRLDAKIDSILALR